MAMISSQKLDRTTGRAINIAERTTNKTVKLASAPLKVAKDNYTKARKALRRERKKHAKELRERDEAVVVMAKKYDSTRTVVLMHLPTSDVGERSSNYTTPDD